MSALGVSYISIFVRNIVYYMGHFRIFDKIDSSLKNATNVSESKKGRLNL